MRWMESGEVSLGEGKTFEQPGSRRGQSRVWAPEGILGAKEAGDGWLLRLWGLVGGELSHPLRPRLPRFQARDAAARGVFPPFRSAVLLTHSGCLLRSTRLPVWGERCQGSSSMSWVQCASVPGHPVQWQPPSFAWTVLSLSPPEIPPLGAHLGHAPASPPATSTSVG